MVGSEKIEKVIRSPNELPAGWQKPTLAEVAEIIMGQSPSSEYYNSDGEGLPFFQGKAEFGELYPEPVKWCSQPNKVARKDDVLISVRAPVGPTNLAITECCIGRGLAAIRPRDGVPSKYILYYLRSIESGIDALGTGTTFKAISGGILRSIPIPIAPAAQQDRIVAEIEKQFSRLDEAVANLKRVKSNLKRYKASVLKAAVEGKLTEDWRKQNPNVEAASKLLERIVAQGPDRQSDKTKHKRDVAGDSGALFQLPKNWVWCKSHRLAEVIDPQPSHRTPEEISGGVPYIGMGDVTVLGAIDFSNARKVSAKILEEHRHRYQLRKGNFIFGKIGTLGAPVLLPEPFEYTLSANVVLFQPDPKITNPGFVLAYMRSPVVGSYLARMSKATSQPAFGIQKVREMPVPLPPLEEQDEIVAEVERRLSVIDKQEAAVQANFARADRLRQSILRSAFSGRLAEPPPMAMDYMASYTRAS